MNPIRIHLGPMPAMLRTIIGDLLRREDDLLIVGGSQAGEDVLRRAHDDEADVLITNDRGGDEGHCLDFILSASPISILAISDDGRSADAVDLIRRPVALNGGGESRLVDAVRQIAECRNHLDASLGRQRTN